ncbi:hypothetical protein, partial [Shinella sp. M27]
MPAEAMMPPTEMSMPRAMMTAVMPNATIATIALCWPMLRRFATDRKAGCARANPAMARPI